MTRQEKKRILAAKEKHLRRKYPTYKDNEIGSFLFYDKTDTSANGLTACVVDFLTYEGHHAERINTMGTPRAKYRIDPNTGRKLGQAVGVTWTKSGSTPGSADISARVRQRSTDQFAVPVSIEVKYGKDRQSQDQMKYESAVTAAGGVYLIVGTFGQFLSWYDQFTAQ